MASDKQMYAVPITDALDDPETKLSTLVALHKRATAMLKAQGDLKTAVKAARKGNRPPQGKDVGPAPT
jgi:hypothetical protein